MSDKGLHIVGIVVETNYLTYDRYGRKYHKDMIYYLS